MGQRFALRASDDDREHVVERLRNAVTEGRLTHEEFEERLHLALGARTYGQLDPLLADLPGGEVVARSGYVPAPRTNGMAIASLVTGVAGFLFLWGIGPLLAVALGFVAKHEIKRANGSQTGSGLATAGIILGVFGLLLLAAVIMGAVVGPHVFFHRSSMATR